MKAWLQTVLNNRADLPEEAEGYLLGRGMLEETIDRLGVGLWRPAEVPAPDPSFKDRYGEKGLGEWIRGWLVYPFLSPRGAVLGFEARRWWGDKKISDYRLPSAMWNPVFIGLTPETLQRIWDGGDVWIVEGLFDMTALERIVPAKDVVLATLRAKVSDTHVEFLRRFMRSTATVHVAYDNDETGQKQIHGWTDEKTGKHRWGALERLQWVNVSCRAIPYRGGKDPGEIWEKTGTEGLRQAFAHVL